MILFRDPAIARMEDRVVKLDDCLKIINRRLRAARQEVAKRQHQGLQCRPWQHRIEELESLRREIAALATPEEVRGKRHLAAPPVQPVARELPGLPS
jgi:hypothetical protein